MFFLFYFPSALFITLKMFGKISIAQTKIANKRMHIKMVLKRVGAGELTIFFALAIADESEELSSSGI